MLKLEVVRLRECVLVRPFGELGTHGSSPKAWNIAVCAPMENPTRAFLRVNPDWVPEKLEFEIHEGRPEHETFENV